MLLAEYKIRVTVDRDSLTDEQIDSLFDHLYVIDYDCITNDAFQDALKAIGMSDVQFNVEVD